MKGNILTPVVLVVIFALQIKHPVKAQNPAVVSKKAYASNQLIVKFSSDIEIARQSNGRLSINNTQIRDLNEKLNVISAESLMPVMASNTDTGNSRRMPYHPILYTFGSDINVTDVIAILMKTGFYAYAEPNYVGYGGGACTITPNDEYYNKRQWALHNDGTVTSNSIEGADIDMESAWAISTGDSSVVVAILDSGIKLDHPEFNGRLWVNEDEIPANLLDDDQNGYYNDINGWDFVNNDNDPADDHGHGTNVAGIVGASGNNGIGYAGVNWQCKLMACKILDENNSGFYSAWISAIYYAVNNGADVINMSVGGTNNSASLEDAVNYAINNGVPVVASMMNQDSEQVFYPAGYEATIAVGATDPDHTRSSPFFYDPESGSNYGDHIDIVAPGNYIYGLNYKGNHDYNRMWGGTSQAAPYVTGVISLLQGMNSELSIDSIKNILYSTALDQVGLADEDTEGWDKYHGHGVLNAHKALQVLDITVDNQNVCSGDSYTFPDGSVLNNITDNIKHTSTLQAASNCDSVVVTSLIVKPTYSESQEVFLCSGEGFTFPDGTIQTDINEEFTHVSHLKTISNCDSLITTAVKVNPVYNFEEEVSLCSGGAYTFPDGTSMEEISDEVIYTSKLQTVLGCDSIVTTTLKVKPRYDLQQEVLVCNGGSYVFADGTEQNDIVKDTVYTSHLQTALLCDSLITTVVRVNPNYSYTEEVEVCYNSNYTFPDGTKQEDIKGEITHVSMLQTAMQCDSIITTQVRVKEIDSTVQINDNTLICNTEGGEYQWVSCSDGFIHLEGEINQEFTPVQSGNYAVIIHKEGCEARSECFAITPLGVNPKVTEIVKVYPNPTNGQIRVESLSDANIAVEVTDLSGKAIQVPVSLQSGIFEINIDQPPGIYLLNIYSNEGVETFKVVKD